MVPWSIIQANEYDSESDNEDLILEPMVDLHKFPDTHNEISFNPAFVYHIDTNWEEEIQPSHRLTISLCNICGFHPSTEEACLPGLGKIKIMHQKTSQCLWIRTRHQHIPTKSADLFPVSPDTSDSSNFSAPSDI